MTINNNKLLSKYLSMPIQVRASLWFLICGILQNGLSIITLPIFTRVLNSEQYGLSSTFFAWTDIVVVFATLRLSYGAVDKGLIKFEKNRDGFISSMLGLSTTVSLIALSVFLLFHVWIEKLTEMPFVLCLAMFAYQIFSPSLMLWMARNKFELQYKAFAIVTVSTSILCTLLNLFAVLTLPYDRGLTKILSYEAIWSIVNILVYIYIFIKGKTFYNKGVWKFALAYNVPLIPYFLSTIIMDKADRVMINSMVGMKYVAYYSVAYNLGRLMVLLTAAIDATFTPWMYQKFKNREFNLCKSITFSIVVAFMGVATLFMLFAPELIKIFASSEYAEAIYVIPPVVASYLFVCMYSLISKVEFYFEKSKVIAAITIICAAINIGLNYVGIKMFGYIAASYTTLICYILTAIVHSLYSKRILKDEKVQTDIFPWKGFSILGLAMIGLCVLVSELYRLVIIRYMIICGIIIVMIIKRNDIINLIKSIKNR